MSSVNKEDDSTEEPPFENIPDVILLKIFSYLYLSDLSHAGSACTRWHRISKSQVLWKRVDAQNIELNPLQVQKLISILPMCVNYLHIRSSSSQQCMPFITPRNAITIRERCPHLKTLVIESAFIAKHIHFTDVTVEDLPQKISVLSLRRSFFHTDQFFCSVSHSTVPKIEVLDCSYCWCVRDTDVLFFSRLSGLQEVYLAGCPITDEGVAILLKTAVNLKVIDLEETGIGEIAIDALSSYCSSLERLYAGNTGLKDKFLLSIKRGTLKELQVICMRGTGVSCIGARYLMSNLPALTKLYMTLQTVSAEFEHHLCVKSVPTIQLDNPLVCDHFFNRNHDS